MKLFRFKDSMGTHYGIMNNEGFFKLHGNPFDKIVLDYEIKDPAGINYIIPVEPPKIIGIGINYYDHIISQNIAKPESPYIFYKPTETLLLHDEVLILPNETDLITSEAELAVVIKNKCKNVTVEEADSVILGYTAANDATDKTDFIKERHMGKAKAYDTFTPIGRYIDIDLKTKDIKNLSITLKINDITKQHSTTGNMIFPVEYLVSYLSLIMTLMPGDIILTGTPEGPAKVTDGDIVEISVGSLDKLRHTVKL